jgi:hypothetical protein
MRTFQSFFVFALLVILAPLAFGNGNGPLAINTDSYISDRPESIVWSPDGNFIVAALNTIQVFSAVTGERVQTFHPFNLNEADAVAITSDNQYVFSGDEYGRLTMWSVESGAKVWEYSYPLNPWIFDLALSADDKYLVVAKNGIDIWQIDWTTKTCQNIKLENANGNVFSTVWHDKRWLEGNGNGSIGVKTLGVNDYKYVRYPDNKREPLMLSFSLDGSKAIVVTGGYDAYDSNDFNYVVEVFDIVNSTENYPNVKADFSYTGRGAVVSQDTKHLFVTDSLPLGVPFSLDNPFYMKIYEIVDWQLGPVVWSYDMTKLNAYTDLPYAIHTDLQGKFSPDGKKMMVYGQKSIFIFSLNEQSALPTPTATPTPTNTPVPTPTVTPTPIVGNTVIIPSPPSLPTGEETIFNKTFVAGDISSNDITVVPVNFEGTEFEPAGAEVVSLVSGQIVRSLQLTAQEDVQHLLRINATDVETASLYLLAWENPVAVTPSDKIQLSVSVYGDGVARVFIGIMDINADGTPGRIAQSEFVPSAGWNIKTLTRPPECDRVVFLIQVIGPGQLYVDRVVAEVSP